MLYKGSKKVPVPFSRPFIGTYYFLFREEMRNQGKLNIFAWDRMSGDLPENIFPLLLPAALTIHVGGCPERYRFCETTNYGQNRKA